MKYIKFILITLCLPFISLSQTIKGTVTDNFNVPISYANIDFKDFENPNEISEYSICKNGKYFKKIEKKYKKIIIEINVFNYKKEIFIIDNLKKEKTYIINFKLSKNENSTKLDEVVIIAKKKPFIIKKDTVKYNVKSYLNGSERKVQDVIKNLPGIEVNEQSGEIKYKGKSVETVLLESDNLFGYNYSLGTKNINVDMVHQIEAIENYSENPILKGIEGGDKVALNLKLKKGKIDFSGNFDLGYGAFIKNKQTLNINSNILGITKNYKSFATLAYNNIGINHSTFDYFGHNSNIEQIKEKDYFAEKIIPEINFSTVLNNNRANINSQYFGNYNAIFKINKQIKIKTNLYYLQDEIQSKQIFENLYSINENSFNTSDTYHINKQPKQYRGDLEIKYNSSKKSLLEYNLRVRQENITTKSGIFSNNNRNLESQLKSEDFYFKQNLLFTNKISKKKALQFSFFQSTNRVPQESYYVIDPTNKDIQNAKFKKNYIKTKATLLGTTKNKKYTFSIGNIINYNVLQSDLFNESQPSLFSKNNLDYQKTTFYQLGSYTINSGEWSFSSSYLINYIKQMLDDKIKNTLKKQNNFIIEPSIKIKYKLNQTSFLLGKLGYNQTSNIEKHLFLNQILINNRISINNTPSFNFQKTLSYGIYYYNNDLYNQLQLKMGINYQNNKGNYFTDSEFTENTTFINYFFLPKDNKDLTFSFLIDKYVSFLESTLKLTSNYSISEYKNIVNDSDLRSNKNKSLETKFYIKTAFNGLLNFKNTFHLSNSISENSNRKIFSNTSYNNKFDIILNPSKKWLVLFSSNYLLPNIKKKNERFFFLDFSVRYKPKNERLEFNFRANNILNENNIEQIQTSDFSTSIFRTNILPNHYLLNMTYSF